MKRGGVVFSDLLGFFFELLWESLYEKVSTAYRMKKDMTAGTEGTTILLFAIPDSLKERFLLFILQKRQPGRIHPADLNLVYRHYFSSVILLFSVSAALRQVHAEHLPLL